MDLIILLNFWSIVIGLLDPGGCALRDGMKYRMYWFFLSLKFQCCTLSCYSGFLGVHRNFKSIRFWDPTYRFFLFVDWTVLSFICYNYDFLLTYNFKGILLRSSYISYATIVLYGCFLNFFWKKWLCNIIGHAWLLNLLATHKYFASSFVPSLTAYRLKLDYVTVDRYLFSNQENYKFWMVK